MTIKRQILIVDDEEDVVEMLSSAFESQKFTIHTAPNANKAFDCIINNFIDILITDIRMEYDNGGIELLNQIGALPQDDRPIIFIISGEDDLTPDESKQYKVQRYLKKPFKVEELVSEILALTIK